MTAVATSFATDLMPWLMSALDTAGPTLTSLLEIIGINILLSGDNAVVIAIACRSLPPTKRAIGIMLGVVVAISLRIVFTLFLQVVLHWPWLKVIGSLLLFWIAIQLVTEPDDEGGDVKDHKTLAGAVWTIAIADVVMSLDNVLAIAAAAHDNIWLIIFGLAMSIPLIAGGATMIINLLARFPLLLWAGAALLGWVAGGMIAAEPALETALANATRAVGAPQNWLPAICSALGAAFVIAAGVALVRWRPTSPTV